MARQALGRKIGCSVSEGCAIRKGEKMEMMVEIRSKSRTEPAAVAPGDECHCHPAPSNNPLQPMWEKSSQ